MSGLPLERSRALFDAARSLIPGGVNSPARAYRAVGGTPPHIRSGRGAIVTDVDGNEYVDLVLAYGPLILGHAHEEVRAALHAAVDTGTAFGTPTAGEVELAGTIIERVPGMEMVRLVNSGTEATMSALRLARAATGRELLVKFEGCYHGHGDSFLVKAGSGDDALSMRFRELKLRKNPECPVCGDNPTVTELIDYQQFCGIPQQEAQDVSEQTGVPEITVTELKSKLDAGEPLFVLDVREPHEYDICHLDGTTLIPLGQLPNRVNELNSADDIVVHCRSGVRSAKAVGFLQQAGFSKVKNLKGGILAWSDEIDPSVPKY